ncbi:MAG: hypothetical protein ABWY17_04630, partial [Pseudomonas sp.]
QTLLRLLRSCCYLPECAHHQAFATPVASRNDTHIPTNVARDSLSPGAMTYAGFSCVRAAKETLRHGKNL